MSLKRCKGLSNDKTELTRYPTLAKRHAAWIPIESLTKDNFKRGLSIWAKAQKKSNACNIMVAYHGWFCFNARKNDENHQLLAFGGG